MSPFADSVDRHFAGAISAPDFLVDAEAVMTSAGFTDGRTLAVVSVCRDELTSTLVTAIEAHFGAAFTLAGLGGIPTLGLTGWKAALAHIPDDGERGALAVFGFPHIGIDIDGTVGLNHRRGQQHPTPTCGALCAVLDGATTGDGATGIEIDDYEATRLAHRLLDDSPPPRDLVDLTRRAASAVHDDLWSAIDHFEVWRDHDVAVLTGIEIHGADGADHIQPLTAEIAGPDGSRSGLA